MGKVSRVFGGQLPISNPDPLTLTARPWIVDHRQSGTAGLYTIWGIKYTTALAVARQVLGTAFGDRTAPREPYRPAGFEPISIPSREAVQESATTTEPQHEVFKQVADLGRATKACHLDDLVLRRCGLGDHPGCARELAGPMAATMTWSDDRRDIELARFLKDTAEVPGMVKDNRAGNRNPLDQGSI